MSRRVSPEAIHIARRCATRNRLMQEMGWTQETAERLCGEWEAEAKGLGIERGTPTGDSLIRAWRTPSRSKRRAG